MDKKTYLKELRKLNNAYIEANRQFQDGEVVTTYAPPKRYVILKATGVAVVSNCTISYDIQEINADGSLGIKCYIYGYEWEKFKSTGDTYELEEDIL